MAEVSPSLAGGVGEGVEVLKFDPLPNPSHRGEGNSLSQYRATEYFFGQQPLSSCPPWVGNGLRSVPTVVAMLRFCPSH